MIRIEICEGKVAHASQKYYKEYGHTTACTLRLCEPWFGLDKVIYGDSWFASVKCAQALLNNGTHFIGDVKTNHSLFCGEALENTTGKESGAWSTYASSVIVGHERKQIYAVSHRRGEKVHKFISTCGTSLAGSSLKVTHLDDEEAAAESGAAAVHEIARKCPKVLNDATAAQPAVDRHNRYRQYILGMEKRINTNSFSTRFGTTMHGILATDAFFARTAASTTHWRSSRSRSRSWPTP